MEELISLDIINGILSLLSRHNSQLQKNNAELIEILKSREAKLRELTKGGYSISENLDKMRKETHNLFASIQVISEATEVALSALEEQKENWEVGYANLDSATLDFEKTTEIITTSIHSLRELGEKIKKIEDAMQEVRNISHLTRGVSRNAGIKAYHAGEQGKGFEIISRELNQLTKESLNITETVPKTIERFRTKTKEALNFITELTHNIEVVKHQTAKMKENLQSSEKLLRDFMEFSTSIHNAVRQQIVIKDKLRKSEEEIANFFTQSLIETGNITSLEESQSSLSKLINRYVDNLTIIISSLRETEKGKLNTVFENSVLNNEKLNEYIKRVFHLTSQIKEIAKDGEHLLQSQKNRVSQMLTVIIENRDIKQEIIKKTYSLMGILNKVKELFATTNNLSEEMFSVTNGMQTLIENANTYFVALEDDIKWVEDILLKLKKFFKRTHLLALYASIESARAFDFTKELNVIVGQIKELSNQSSASLKTIDDAVKEGKSSLNNVHNIMFNTSNKLSTTKDDFEPVISGFSELNSSTKKLTSLVKEMVNNLNKQTELEQKLINLKDILLIKINDNIKKSQELERETDITRKVVANILNILGDFEKNLAPFQPHIAKPKTKILRLSTRNDPIDIYPSKTTDATSNRISMAIFRGLVEQGIDANIIPSIARRWKLSSDGLVWEFLLRDDAKFHNGETLTSEDIKLTIKNILIGPHSYMFEIIKGAKDYIHRKKRDIEGIKLTGSHSLQIELNQPHIPFLRNLSITAAGIIKRTTTGLVGAGPFRLKKWDKGKEVVLEAFKDYFGKKPFCDEIHFVVCPDSKELIERFLREEVDIIDLPSSVDKEELLRKGDEEKIKILSVPIYDVYYIGINVRASTPFRNKLVRQAMNFAINRREYIDATAKDRAIPAKGIFPPNFSTYNEALEGYSYNPERARLLLKNAGYPDGLPGEYQFDIRDARGAKQGAEIIKTQLREVGINIKINPISWEELLKNSHMGKSQLFLLGWSNDNGDPDSFVYPLFHSKNWGEPGNAAFYKNETVDRLLDEAAASTDHYKRIELYRQIEKIIVDDAPWIFLYHSKHIIALQSYVNGYLKNPITSERLEDIWLSR